MLCHIDTSELDCCNDPRGTIRSPYESVTACDGLDRLSASAYQVRGQPSLVMIERRGGTGLLFLNCRYCRQAVCPRAHRLPVRIF